MSRFSGKADLFDYMNGLAGWHDKDGNKVNYGEGNGPYYGDEYQDFLEFKRITNGVIHQHRKIKVNEYNQDYVKEHCKGFDYTLHTKEIKDARTTKGYREESYYTYFYYGKEYTLKELNKKGVYITIDIHFDTILDLIPYYPYIVSMSCSNDGKQIVYISNQSFVDGELEEHLENGWYSDYWQHYKKELQGHYIDIVLKYFNPKEKEYKQNLM